MSTTADPVTPTPAGNDSSNSGAIVPALPPTTTLTPADLAVAKDKLAKGGKTAEQTQADLTAAWSSIASAMMDAQTKLQSNPNDPSLKDQVTVLQKQKKDLEDFMLDNHVSLPSSSLADAFKGVGWAEVYQATYLILHATDLCFEILKYAPLPEDLANAPIIAPDEKQDKQIDDQVAKDVEKAFKKDETPANGDIKPEDKPEDKPADKPAETPANGTPAPAPPAQPVIPHDKPLVDPKKVAETWEKIRNSIVLVLKTSKPQLDNLFQVVDTVSRLGKRFNEFLQFVPSVEKYNVAPEHLQFVREVIADLNALATKVESDTGKYFAAVVDDSSVLLKQAGQEYLKANADTVTEGEIQYSKLEGQLLTLYDDEIKSRDLIAYKKGEVAGLILRRDLTVQRVISLKESKATLLAQSNALTKAIQEKSTSFNEELTKMSTEISNNRKTVAANQQARIDAARVRGEKEKADIQKQIADLQKQLDATPPTVNQVSTVRNSGFIGIGASSSTTTTPIENPAYKAINDRMNTIKANESQALTAAANIDRNYTEDQNKWEDKYITTQQEELTRLQGNQEAYSKKLAQMKTEVDAQIKDIDTQIVTLQGTSDTVADAASVPSVTPTTTTPAPAPGAGPVVTDADDAPPVFTEGSLLNKLEAQITTGKATLENLTANLETKHANLQDQEKRIRASMAEWKKNIDAAKRKRDTAIANYGMTPGSDASVKATYDLLSKLLMLPKTIDLNVDHFINFKRQILDMVKNVSTGLTSIENGANKLPPFAPTRIGVRNWLNAIDKYDTATKLYTKSIDRKALQAYDKDPKMADRINKMANLDDDDQFVMGLYLPDYINNEYDPDTYRADDWKLQFETGLRIVAQNLLSLNVVVEVLQPQLTSVQNNKDNVKLK